ncbi:unnamed protein product [Lymnaea stagnalis]|uniref:Ig-like domain-containing protein n=1 Tax=Lymnaea stagnalis TaxID=6523 RepID=A0AAV2I858_LYMST
MELIKYLLTATLLITAQCQLIDRSEIEDGGSFNLTCDVSRIGNSNVPPIVTSLYSLTIERTVVSGTQTIAVYSPALFKNFTKTIPDNRPWVIEASGGKSSSADPDLNRATIKLTLYVPDAKCTDAGIYSCNANFPSVGGVSTASRSQNMTSKAKTEDPIINSDHHNGNNPHYSSNPEGQNLTLTCSVLGPKSLVLKWQYRATNGFNLEDYPYTNAIKVANPLPVPGTTCDQYRLESALALIVQSQETLYVCAVLDGNNRVTETNFTIGIQTDQTQEPNTGPSEEPAGANVGAIVGGVIGGLVLIAIIVIVVYFCWYRKRNDDDSGKFGPFLIYQ